MNVCRNLLSKFKKPITEKIVIQSNIDETKIKNDYNKLFLRYRINK